MGWFTGKFSGNVWGSCFLTSKSHDHNVNKGPWPWLQNGEFFWGIHSGAIAVRHSNEIYSIQ